MYTDTHTLKYRGVRGHRNHIFEQFLYDLLRDFIFDFRSLFGKVVEVVRLIRSHKIGGRASAPPLLSLSPLFPHPHPLPQPPFCSICYDRADDSRFYRGSYHILEPTLSTTCSAPLPIPTGTSVRKSTSRQSTTCTHRHTSPGVGIHSAHIGPAVWLMVDPHFGVIDDAGYHPVFTGFSRVCVVIYTAA